MVRDRTIEIKPDMSNARVDTSTIAESNDPNNIKAFFAELEFVKEKISIVKNSVHEVKALHDRALNNVISDQENNQITQELEDKMDKTTKVAGQIRVKLKEMDASIKALKKKGNVGDINIRQSQHGVLTKNFLDAMLDYKALQEKYQGKYKERMQRQALVVNPTATVEEVEKMIESENTQQIFSGQIMHAGQRNEAKRALLDIQNKHKDVVRIEKSIIELQQLFMDLSVLLAAQGEMVDQIAIHVNNAVEDTNEGVKELQGAVKLQKSSRKKMCMIVGGIIVLIVIVALIAYFTTRR